MLRFKEILDKFPGELRDAIIEFHDFLREEYIIKREEFEELKKIVGKLALSIENLTEKVESLAIAQQRTEERLNSLAIAQQRTEERLNSLAERVESLAIAQQRTEERLNSLAIAQQRTEERLNSLAIAQERTEKEIRTLTITVKRIQKELGGLSHSVGFDLENQAYKALPNILKERFGIEIKDRLLRKYIEYPDGREEEINIYGEAQKNGKKIFIIGESKTHLSRKDIEKFKKRIERLKKVIGEEIFPIFVVHTSSPKIVKFSLDSGFPVFFSYEF